MIERTFDTEDPRDLPYRFTYSRITDEVFIISFWQGFRIAMLFENRQAFHRFLVEGNKTDSLIADKALQESEEILRGKQGV